MSDRLPIEQKIVEHYTRMAEISERMRLAAYADDWNGVGDAEKECARVICDLSALGDLAPTDPALRRQKLDLMRRVLADDAEIRLLTQPWLKKLDQLLQTPDASAQLDRAYGTGSMPG